MKLNSISCMLWLNLLLCNAIHYAQAPLMREKINIDAHWRFNLGHLYDTKKDFNHATAYFSYLTKAGFADGAAAATFDDRSWRVLDLPHDWAVEQGFSEQASYSHGFKTAGKGYPDKSIGWYRKALAIPLTDLGKQLSVQFDGVFRNAQVFFNGFYLGTAPSGYTGFSFDITPYINYGGDNTLVVRVDASMEEGWFYEGAGIYRHVYLLKTNGLHIAPNGTAVTSVVDNNSAQVSISTTLINKANNHSIITLQQQITDASGRVVAEGNTQTAAPQYHAATTTKSTIALDGPTLWSLEQPYLYTVTTTVLQENKVVDIYHTTFGIRTITFDAENGFFLNGKSVKLKGINNHQDHAGIGTALPDALQYYRIKKLKDMGANAYRCSHHPPTPELLEACDQLGMLVIDETRLMGTNEYHIMDLQKMIERDRNHPSIICWSVGNEEWNIEGNVVGERITQVMQDFTKQLDPTRPVTVGLSSGFQSGISNMVDLIGYNYMANGDIDKHRAAFPKQPGMGTEEGSTFATRGIYETNDALHYQSAYDKKPRPSFYSIEEGWNFYAKRPYLAGMFIWTGFDYRGEPTPYGYPSVTSYFGMMDVCGFPKDNVFYLKSWWGTTPTLHLLPHWNWQGKEGKELPVWVYANVEEVELFLNKKSLGRKAMPNLGHLEWQVAYESGTLEAVGYTKGKRVLVTQQQTTTDPVAVTVAIDFENDDKDLVKVLTVSTRDSKGRTVPTAANAIDFTITGGKILGVGNGNPTSLEPDQFIENRATIHLTPWQEQRLYTAPTELELTSFTTEAWQEAFKDRGYKEQATAYNYQTTFEFDKRSPEETLHFYYTKIGATTKLYLNGHEVTATAQDDQRYVLPKTQLRAGKNILNIVCKPLQKNKDWDVMNTDPGLLQRYSPAAPYSRKLFNGLAQIIIQQQDKSTPVKLTATSTGLKAASIIIK